MKCITAVGYVSICALALILTASAQEQSGQQNPTEQARYSYVPELAELMTITQARYTRLNYAPETNNWSLAAYDAAHLRKSFDVAVKLYPVFQDVQQARLIADVTEPALDAIDKAIKAKDLPAFNRSFKALTNACNSCHQQAKVGFIVIEQPYKPASGPQRK